MEALTIDEDVEIDRDASTYFGGGSTQIWYRWGYVCHPAGYNWAGSQDKFPSDAEYQYVVESGTPGPLDAAAVALPATTTGTFVRKTDSVLSLGILPVFHS
jgi:hypothetical protein